MTQHVRTIPLLVALLVAADARPGMAQAAPNLAVARVRYNSLKNTTKPDGDLKVQIDAIDRELAEATRLGRTGDVRRLLLKGTTLLNGRPWTELDEFDASLVLRTDRVFVDASKPWQVRLEQTFLPGIELTAPLTVRTAIRPLLSQPPGAPESYTLTRFEGVARDLRDAPLPMDLDLAAVPNGPYMLDVEVLDAARSLGTANLRLWALKGLDERVRGLEASSQAVSDAVRPDVLYPLDYMRKTNRGLIEAGAFDLARELESSEAIAVGGKGGTDPFAGRTGDFERHYVLEPAREIMPYRVLVPKSYDGSKPFPLIIALHGLGQTEDSFFDGYQRRVPQLAEERGYLVAAPLGYRVDGFYGSSVAGSSDPATRRARELSEQDVMEVLRRMRRDYRVDETRIYLMGHSMGAIGTWYLAAKYPETWAAVAPFSGTGQPASVERMKGIPQFVVHGDADPTVSVEGSRAMVAEMKKLGADVTYVEVAGGDHVNVVVPNLPGAFDFFSKKRRSPAPTERR
jgi:poly(3-hydroxybutyrate) depolymerase